MSYFFSVHLTFNIIFGQPSTFICLSGKRNVFIIKCQLVDWNQRLRSAIISIYGQQEIAATATEQNKWHDQDAIEDRVGDLDENVDVDAVWAAPSIPPSIRMALSGFSGVLYVTIAIEATTAGAAATAAAALSANVPTLQCKFCREDAFEMKMFVQSTRSAGIATRMMTIQPRPLHFASKLFSLPDFFPFLSF